MNNVCLEADNTSNICINTVFKNIDTAVSKYEPKETEQKYKTLTYEGVVTDIAKCTFNKPSQNVDIYATIDNTPMCIGTLTSSGTVTLGCLNKSIVCTETYQWNRTMSRVVSSCFDTACTNNYCLSYVAVKCPTKYNGSLDYYYYLDGCKCGTDIRGCPIYNSNCLVKKCFKSGCTSENNYCIETCIYQTFITEQYWNIYRDSYNGQWSWKQRSGVDQCCLGYICSNLSFCDKPGITTYPQAYSFDEECEEHIDTDYKYDELCTAYCCLKCYKGPYDCCVCYPYREYCEDYFLTQAGSYATLSHGKCFCSFITCDNYDLLDLDQWVCKAGDDICCYDRSFGNGCLTCLKTFKPSFEADNYIDCCDIKRWHRKGCWCTALKPDYVINGNPNTIYFTPVESINITKCDIDKTPNYDEKCYSNYLNKLKSISTLFSTEPTKEICFNTGSLSGCCVKIADGTRFGNQRATVQYCVVQTIYQPTIDISSCCVCITERYL